MLQPIERPLKNVIPRKIKFYTIASYVVFLIFLSTMMFISSDYIKGNTLFNFFIVLALFFLLVLSDINIWTFKIRDFTGLFKKIIIPLNISVYIFTTILMISDIKIILIISLAITIIDLINSKNSFIWRGNIIGLTNALFFITRNLVKGMDIKTDLIYLVLFLVLNFTAIYLEKITIYSERLISEEKEKRSNTFLHNQISQLEVKQKAAYYDPLTKILNRRGFELEVKPVFDERKKSLKPFGLLMVDIDHFKLVNDTYGHDKGDVALQTLAETIERAIRPSTDAIARFGGEEFIITTIGVETHEQLYNFGERIRSIIERTKWDGDKTFTISIGAVLFPYTYINNLDDLLKKADIGLYQAKETGRNKVIVYEEKE